MIVVVFRSRLNGSQRNAYEEMAQRMSELARGVPGYRSHKAFQAPDGERVTVVEFDSEEGLRTWARHPGHVQAKKLGRTSFFDSYRVQVCRVLRDSAFPVSGE